MAQPTLSQQPTGGSWVVAFPLHPTALPTNPSPPPPCLPGSLPLILRAAGVCSLCPRCCVVKELFPGAAPDASPRGVRPFSSLAGAYKAPNVNFSVWMGLAFAALEEAKGSRLGAGRAAGVTRPGFPVPSAIGLGPAGQRPISRQKRSKEVGERVPASSVSRRWGSSRQPRWACRRPRLLWRGGRGLLLHKALCSQPPWR